MLKRVLSLIGLVSFVVFTTQCTVDNDQFTGPTVDQDKYLIYKTFSARSQQLLSGGDTTTVMLELLNSSNKPAGGIGATFDARLGTITSSDTTDTLFGRATALYTSGDAGIDRILVSTGTKEDSLFLLIVDRLSVFTLSADTTELIADGESHLQIKGVVKDQTGAFQEGLTLYFSTTAGTITTSGVTDANGEVVAILTAPADSQDVTAIVRAGLQPLTAAPRHLHSLKSQKMSIARTISGPEEGTIPEKTPKLTTSNAITTSDDSLTIRFKGITISLLPDRTELLASGVDTTRILVTLSETSTHLPLSFQPFSATTTRGILTGDFITDANGQASLLLTSGTVSGLATITLAVGNRLEATTQIDFISATPTTFSLFTDAATILADGTSQSTITVTVLDTLGNPVTGKTVIFATTAGVLSRTTAQTNTQGEATITLTSDFSQTNQVATVSASVVGYPNLNGSLDITFMGISLSLVAEQSVLVANGSSTVQISAVVFQTETNGAVIDREVEFSTSLGTITSPATTNSSGVATATLTAGIFPGTATVIGRFGSGLRDTITVEFLNSGPNSMTLEADVISILANGTSQSTLTATIQDTLGNPVEGALVMFSSSEGLLDPTSTTTDASGQAVTQFTSISSATDITVTIHSTINAGQQLVSYASIYHPEARVVGLETRVSPPLRTVAQLTSLSDSLQITLRGVTVRANPVDPILVANGTSTTEIQTSVFETTTNNPVANSDVNFATTLGTITGSALTNASGVAVATLTSPYTQGTAQIVATYGTGLQDTTTVEFLSGAANSLVIGAFTESLLADGVSSTTVFADVTDTLGNPLPNVVVQFGTDQGELSGTLVATDVDGRAAVDLLSSASQSDLTAHVSCQVQSTSRSDGESIATNRIQPRTVFRSILTDTVAIQFRGLTLSLSSEDSLLVANGTSTSTIQASLYETSTFTPVTDTEITFSTTRGTITGSEVTDPSGTANATFTSGSVAGIAQIIARTGNTINDTFNIELLTGGPQHLTLGVDQTSVLADGMSTVEITATLADTLGNPVVGRPVIFSSDYGVLESETVVSDASGVATTTLTSAASVTDLLTTIRAHIENVENISDSLTVTFRGITIQVSATDTILVANGEANTTITAVLTETEHNASVANTEVRFRTNLGIVTGSTTTDENGLATGTLTTGIFAGTAQIVAEVGNALQDTTTVHFVSHTPRQLRLNLAENSLLADGSSSTVITGIVVDSLDVPVANVPVSLTISAGSLEAGTLTTDGNGVFTTTLVSEPSQVDLHAQVNALVIASPAVADSADVEFRGYHMNLTANPDGITADGHSTALIAIELLETTSGNPVVNKAYSLSTNLGSIPAGGTTDEQGQASAVLTSGMQAGTARVLISAGIVDSVDVQFYSINPTSVTLTADGSIFLGDGVATSVLTATVTDTLGNPVEGIRVNFPLAGEYTPSATGITDAQGQVQRAWSLATSVDSTAYAVATLPDYSLASDTVSVLFQGVVLALTASPTSAYADGSSSVVLSLMAQVDGTGNPIVNHSFSLSTDQGMITAGGVTDANGMGTGTLTNPDAVTGVFTVTATLGELSTATTVNYLALIPDSLIAEADVTSLLADGEASTTVTATVFDPNGNPVSGLPLVFATDQGTIWPLDATTDSLGQASATLTSVPSGTDLSAQVVVQSALDASIADTVTVAYRGITVDLTAASHYLVADGLSSTSLSALITESTSGNPVSASTVTWSTTLGVVPSFSVTSALGIATTTFLAGTTPGTAVITANLTSGLTDTVHVNLAQPHDSTLVVSWYNPGGNPTNGTEQLTVTAIFADANAYPIDSVMVNFSLDPATMGVIQSPVMTNVNGVATTSLIYSTQYAGEVLRIWARSNNISGYVDVTLPEAN